MRPDPEAASNERILIALDASSDNWASMRSAAALAASLRAELRGIFIEDADLLQLAEFPGAWEVTLWSARERPLTGANMSRFLKTVAATAEVELARAAKDARVHWSFSVVRGQRAQACMELSEHAEVSVFGGLRRPRKQAAAAEPARRIGQGVRCVYSGSAQAKRALSAAAVVARGLGEGLEVLVAEQEPGRRQFLRDELGAWIERQDLRTKIEDIAPDALLPLLNRYRGAALVLPADCQVWQDPGLFQRLLMTVGCPVILVR